MPMCPTCGEELTYISNYDRWYCYSEKKYAPKNDPSLVPGAVPPCQTCGKELTFVEEYQRYYCYRCQAYAPKDIPPPRIPEAVARIQQEEQKQKKRRDMELAEKWLTAGRFEDAARLYESHEEWEKAGAARRASKVQIVRTVQVDVNQLLEQVRSKGLAVKYTCPQCGGNLQPEPGQGFCPYCGGKVDTELLRDIINRALGGA